MWHIKMKMMKSNTSKISSTYWTNFRFIQKVFIIHASKINSLANFVFSMSSMFGPNKFSKHQRLNCGNLVQKQLFNIQIIDSNDKHLIEKWKSSQKRSHLYFSIVYSSQHKRWFPYNGKLYRKWTKCCNDNDTMN